jgi:hypothetical protein
MKQNPVYHIVTSYILKNYNIWLFLSHQQYLIHMMRNDPWHSCARQQEITNDGIFLARLLYLLLPENTELCAFLLSNILHVNEPYIYISLLWVLHPIFVDRVIVLLFGALMGWVWLVRMLLSWCLLVKRDTTLVDNIYPNDNYNVMANDKHKCCIRLRGVCFQYFYHFLLVFRISKNWMAPKAKHIFMRFSLLKSSNFCISRKLIKNLTKRWNKQTLSRILCHTLQTKRGCHPRK